MYKMLFKRKIKEVLRDKTIEQVRYLFNMNSLQRKR
jgi:hypothetical protein